MHFMLVLLGLQLCVYFLRLILAGRYDKGYKMKKGIGEDGRDFTIIQPIVSGDVNLEHCLRENLRNGREANFVWVIDEEDSAAGEIVGRITRESKKDIRIIVAKNIPKEKNEKVYKQKMALPYARDYIIAVDDDVIFNFPLFYELKDQLNKEDCLITGLPYYRMGKDFLTNLVVGFVNGNSSLTYPVIAELGAVGSINGMCYVIKKEIFEELRVLDRVDEKLSDEYEIARILEERKVKVIQSLCPCSVGTTIHGVTHYISLMRRWMVFANIYMAEKIKISTFTAIVLPTALPFFLIATIVMTGEIQLLPLVLGQQLMIAILSYYHRRSYMQIKEPLRITLYEMVSAYLQPFHYINSLIRPRRIIWRNNKIRINKDGTVRYEKVGGAKH